MSLSPARSALAVHQTKLVAASVACDVARGPILELTDRIEAAKATLRNAESVLAALQTAEAEDVVNCGRNAPANFSVKIAAASAEVERRKRALAALEAKMVELQRPLTDAELTASVIVSRTQALVAAVIAETADDELAEYFDAQRKFVQAEAKVRTLGAECVRRRWLSLAEKVHVSINTTLPARWMDQTFPDWPAFVAALASDAHAAVPAVAS